MICSDLIFCKNNFKYMFLCVPWGVATVKPGNFYHSLCIPGLSSISLPSISALAGRGAVIS